MKTKKWNFNPAVQPWFDQPDAEIRLKRICENNRYDSKTCDYLQQWLGHGYVVVSGLVPEADINEMVDDLQRIWTTDQVMDGLQIQDIVFPDKPKGPLSHKELLAIEPAERERLKVDSCWRVLDFVRYSAATRRIFENPAIARIVSVILDRQALPQHSINFEYGSRQHLHQDSAVFHVQPMNYLVGAWLSCEDIHPDSGPLVYYPGSHKSLLYEAFDNYPQTNARTCDLETMKAYGAYTHTLAERFERKTFLAKKGDIFLWHGMLLHGGSTVNNPLLTRKSFVCHYIPEGMNKGTEVEGPFNW